MKSCTNSFEKNLNGLLYVVKTYFHPENMYCHTEPIALFRNLEISGAPHISEMIILSLH